MEQTIVSGGRGGWLRWGRSFWLFLLAQATSEVGDYFLSVSVALFTYRLTGSALSAAGQMVCAILPQVLLAGWAGQLVDRRDPRRVMVWASLLRAAVVLLYPLSGAVWQIYGITVLRVVGTVCFGPAQAAALRPIVGRSQVVAANGVLKISDGAVALVVPGLAGATVAAAGSVPAFYVTAACYVLVACCAALLRPGPPPDDAGDAGHGTAESAAGASVWRYLRGQRSLLLFLAVYAVLTVGFAATIVVFVPYTEETLGGGAAYGLVISAFYAANIVSGLLLATRGGGWSRGALLAAFFIFPPIWLAYAGLNSLPLVLALVFLEGIVQSAAEAFTDATIQRETPTRLVGRVWSVLRAAIALSTVVGSLLGGALTEALGVPGAFQALAAGTLAALALAVVAQAAVARRTGTNGR